MVFVAFDRLAADRIALVGLADRVQHALASPATSFDLQQAVYDAMDGHDRRVRPYLDLEALLLAGLIRQHAPAEAAAADEAADGLARDLRMLRRDVESGQPLRPALEAVELALRSFVQGRDRIMKHLQRSFPAAALAEVERRFEAYEARLAAPARHDAPVARHR